MWAWKTKGTAFRPRLTIEHTGYSGDVRWQWCIACPSKRGSRMEWGGPLVHQASPQEAWASFARQLERMGATPRQETAPLTCWRRKTAEEMEAGS